MRPVVRRPVGAPLLRGAIVGGAAYHLGRRAAEGAEREAGQDQAIADLRQQPAAPPAPAAPAPAPAAAAAGGDDLTAKLTRLGEMAQQGLLTPEEFTAAKARLLGG
ncbi:SHOCT domain-containing protein [Streptacidiphilus sp. P02-A3a]|nr:SHOCT domain-containing protein [Streptacidiphilus sp. P02-A3a]